MDRTSSKPMKKRAINKAKAKKFGYEIEDISERHLIIRRLRKLRREYSDDQTRSRNNIKDTNKLLARLAQIQQ
jgi:hypothetical protein